MHIKMHMENLAFLALAFCPEEPWTWGRSEGAGVSLSSLHPWVLMQPPQHWKRQRAVISACPTPRSISACCLILYT